MRTTHATTLPFRRLGVILLGAALLCIAGCNIVGPAFYFIHGPEKTKKLYDLDPKKTTVVFIDDRANQVPRRVLRVTIAEEVEKTLMGRKLVKDMVSSQSAMLAAGQDKQGKPMPITEVGQAVKADIVIYATVDQFSLSGDGQSFSPTATLRIKVIDVASDKRLWPEEPRGHPVIVRLEPKQGTPPTSTSDRYKAEDELARQTGLQIARLFFTHEKPKTLTTPD